MPSPYYPSMSLTGREKKITRQCSDGARPPLKRKKKAPDRRLRSADSANGPSHLVMLFFNALKINTEITELRNGFSQKFKSFRKQYTITCMTGITSSCS